MTTALDMIPALGAHVMVRCEQMQIECIVQNVKNSWGQPRLLVAPVLGEGQQWVEMGRVTVIKPTALRLCTYHEDSLSWDDCSIGFTGCEIERARREALR